MPTHTWTSQVQVLSTEIYLPQGQRAGNSRQRQEVEDKGEREGNEREGRVFVAGDKGLSLNKEVIQTTLCQLIPGQSTT